MAFFCWKQISQFYLLLFKSTVQIEFIRPKGDLLATSREAAEFVIARSLPSVPEKGSVR